MSTPRLSLLLDHITIVAPTLAAGVAHVEACLGVAPPFGGRHPRMGTHNHLMCLGDGVFLEIVAIDPEAASPPRPRWFDLDETPRDAAPRLATWVIGAGDILGTLAAIGADAGRAVEITRGDLAWLISIRDDGALPLDGALPTIIQWPEGPHPASRMADLGCRLDSLTVETPDADRVREACDGLADPRVRIQKGPKAKITAQIATPFGSRRLS